MENTKDEKTATAPSAEATLEQKSEEQKGVVQEDVKPEGKEEGKETKPKTIPYERFKEVNDKLKSLQTQLDESKPKAKEKPTEDFWQQKVDFAISNRDYSGEEVDMIADWARFRGTTLAEATKDEMLKAALFAHREKVARESKTPEPSSTTATFNKKALHELGKDELRDNWETIRDKAISAGKKRKQK